MHLRVGGQGNLILCRENPSMTRSHARNVNKQQRVREAGRVLGRRSRNTVSRPWAYGAYIWAYGAYKINDQNNDFSVSMYKTKFND